MNTTSTEGTEVYPGALGKSLPAPGTRCRRESLHLHLVGTITCRFFFHIVIHLEVRRNLLTRKLHKNLLRIKLHDCLNLNFLFGEGAGFLLGLPPHRLFLRHPILLLFGTVFADRSVLCILALDRKRRLLPGRPGNRVLGFGRIRCPLFPMGSPALALVLVGCGAATPSPAAPTGSPSAPAPPTADPAACVAPEPMAELAWWNDRVFYEVFVRSFQDTDGHASEICAG